MNKPTIETLARRQNKGGILLFPPFLLFVLIGLVGCEQISPPQKIGMSPKTVGTSCWDRPGICATKKWKATGLIHGKNPELAEIIVVLELNNTCNPNPDWFRATNKEMEKRRKEPRTNRPKDADKAWFWDLQNEMLNVYESRGELDCSRVRVTLREITLRDEHGIELYRQLADKNTFTHVDPSDAGATTKSVLSFPSSRNLQMKFSVPRVYLKQIKDFDVSLYFNRTWHHGMKRTEKK